MYREVVEERSWVRRAAKYRKELKDETRFRKSQMWGKREEQLRCRTQTLQDPSSRSKLLLK